MSKAATEISSIGGFSFDLCRKNDVLSKNGAKPPYYRKTGTTIVGLVFQVFIILKLLVHML